MFAAFVPNDPHHDAARRRLDSNSEPLLTSDYVLDEVLTLLRVRDEQSRASILGEQILSESIIALHLVTIRELQLAFDIFRTFADKRWSFIDCVSRVVMEELKISTAFAFDDHFRQFGTVTVVPNVQADASRLHTAENFILAATIDLIPLNSRPNILA
jgi:predicted nucleic acid-binding protein